MKRYLLVVLALAVAGGVAWRLSTLVSGRTWLGGAGLVVVALLLWLVPRVQRPAPADVPTFTAENEARKTMAEILGGCILIVGAYQVWLQIEDTRRGLDIAQESQRKTIELSEKGQITDRFTKAVEQLGSAKPDVRLGGIYGLEQIARSSEDQHWPIIELLTTSVRQNAPWPPRSTPANDDTGYSGVQAMLTVIGRREAERERPAKPGDKPHWWNLSRTDLRERDLADGRLSWFDLSGAHLEGAWLPRAQLHWSNLSHANLEGATLGGAILFRTNLARANLQCADLSGADLRLVRAAEVDFRGAIFVETTRLDGADLEAADLRMASLVGVRHWSGIQSLKLANIHGIRDAPPGFVEWALAAGAVQVAKDADWLALLKANGRAGTTIGRQSWPCPSRQ